MNLQRITDFFPWSDARKDALLYQFTLCLDRNSTSGEFSFLYLLLKFLRDGVQVKLVCCNHAPAHYISILRKNNVDAVKLQSTGTLEIVCISQESLSFNPPALSWEQLVDWQNTLLSGYSKAALLIDDLDALELLAPSALAARRFVARSIEALQRSSDNDSLVGGRLAYLVAFGHHPQETSSDLGAVNSTALTSTSSNGDYGSRAPVSLEDEEPALCEYLRYRADTSIVVSALSSGYSSAVHGVVTVTQRDQAPRKQQLQYKALDSGVTCTLVGHIAM